MYLARVTVLDECQRDHIDRQIVQQQHGESAPMPEVENTLQEVKELAPLRNYEKEVAPVVRAAAKETVVLPGFPLRSTERT
jgi:hypothetical protein